MLEVALAKLASLGLAAKLAVASSAVALAGTAAAVTGVPAAGGTPPGHGSSPTTTTIAPDEEITEVGTSEVGTSEVGTSEVESAEVEVEDLDEEAGTANHGAVVSQAARTHEFDEICGNHGKYVSAVAHGAEGCDAMLEEDTGSGPESVTRSTPPKPGKGKGKVKGQGQG